MDSIRVSINDTEVGYYKIEDTGVSFTWQAKLIDEINSFSTSTTKTITLPLTKELKVILKSPDSIDTTNSVSNREYFTININWNGIVTIEGYIKLQRVVILENDEYIEFSIEPKEKDWITQFKDFKLTELDFTLGVDQTHDLTYANIITSETFLAVTREYVYAPIDIAEIGRLQVLWVEQSSAVAPTDTFLYYIGKQVVSAGSTFVANTYGFGDIQLTRYDEIFTEVADAFWNPRGVYKCKYTTAIVPFVWRNQSGYMYINTNNYWQVSDFYPLVRQQAIVKRCFNRIGYGVTIVDNSDYFNNKYNYIHNIKQITELNKKRTNGDYFKVKVKDGQVFTISDTMPTSTEFICPFMRTTDVGYVSNTKYTDTNSDSQANIQAITNVSRFTANEKTIIKFKWNYDFGVFGYGAATAVILEIKQYDSTNILRRVIGKGSAVFSALGEIERGSVESDTTLMSSGDYILCTIKLFSLAVPSFTVNINDGNTLESFLYEGGNFKGKSIKLNEYLPDVPAYDYIKDLSFINNWEFYTNEKLKQVYIVREDYKRTGKQIDFKNKLNISNGVELEEIGLQWPKKSYFNWKQDENDWCIKFIEQVTKASLGNTYEQSELDMACRFGVGVITNLNLFTADVQEFTNNIYSATLDKFDTSNRINFNTVEMKGEETWPHLPTWKRIDYEPRYLTVYFAQTVETNGVNGVTGVVYSIEGNPNHTTYPRVEFGEPLHYGDATGLLKTKYARRERAIKYGWIFRGKFNVDNIDVTEFVETYEDNNFRANYQLQLKGVSVIGELLKVADFSPNTSDQTEIEFVIYRDDL